MPSIPLTPFLGKAMVTWFEKVILSKFLYLYSKLKGYIRNYILKLLALMLIILQSNNQTERCWI